MNAVLEELSKYVLRKQHWDGMHLKEEVQNRLEAIQTLTKSFEKGVFEDGSKNKLSVIKPDIFNERILRCVIAHVLCEFEVPIPRDITCALVKQLQNIPEEIAEMVCREEYPEDILLEYSSVQQASKGLVVECSRDSIMVKTVSLTTGVSMGWHARLLQQLEKWHSILSTQACKFEADMRAMARDTLSVPAPPTCYVYVVDGNYWHKMAFLVVDVSEVEASCHTKASNGTGATSAVAIAVAGAVAATCGPLTLYKTTRTLTATLSWKAVTKSAGGQEHALQAQKRLSFST